MILDVIEGTLTLVGALFILIASIGILRMPDLFLRLQVTSKASALGLGCILLAVALHFAEAVVTIRVGIILCFIVLTIPVATQMVARAGYTTNTPISDETIINELAGHYDPTMHILTSDEPVTWRIDVAADSPVIGRQVMDLGLPADILILAIQRRGEVVVPRGQTRLEERDQLQVLARPEQLSAVRAILGDPSAT